MKYTQRVQVLFTEQQYKTLEELAAKSNKKLGTIIREAVEDTYLKEAKKRKMKNAVDSLLELARTSTITPPEDWEKLEEEYAKKKSGHNK